MRAICGAERETAGCVGDDNAPFMSSVSTTHAVRWRIPPTGSCWCRKTNSIVYSLRMMLRRSVSLQSVTTQMVMSLVLKRIDQHVNLPVSK